MDDLISRQEVIAVADAADYVGLSVEDCKKVTDEVVKGLRQLPSAQPAIEILAWLLAYHQKSFELHGRYMAHEVIGWLVHDFASAFMQEE